MKRIPIEGSSNVLSAGYDAKSQVMEVEFQSKAVYQYAGVEPKLWKSFQSAPSKGKWVAQVLHPWEKYRRVA